MTLPAIDITQPLVWTTKGNLPASALQYQVRWEESPDFVKCIEIYTFEGEVVRESAHVMVKEGAQAAPQQATF